MDMKTWADWELADLQAAVQRAALDAEPLQALRARLRTRTAGAFESRPADWFVEFGAEKNRLYYLGDHWQDGDGWAGPRPARSDQAYLSVMEEIRSAFVSKNAVKEVIRRHRNGVIGKEPAWKLTVRRPLADGEAPTAEEQRLLEEAEALLVAWWDNREVLTRLQDAVDALLWSGRAYLRLFVPAGIMVNGRVPRGGLADSLNRIYLSVPDPFQAALALDPSTQARAGVFLEAGGHDADIAGEMSWVDLTGQTRLRRMLQRGDGGDVQEIALPLNGNLLLAELRREQFITPQIREHQALINMALTMLSRNVVLGGFLERVILNAQLPGKYIPDPDNPAVQKFVPEQFHVGAGTTNALVGIPTYDQAGNVSGYTAPSINYRDPVPIDTFDRTRALAYQGILEEADQLHVLMAGDATASGESRKQAMGQFQLSLEATQTTLEGAGRWLLETALSLAAYFSGVPGRFDALRADFTAALHMGPISALEVGAAIQKQQAGLISRETARIEIGIDDPAAEDERIAREMEASMTRQVELQRRLGLAPTGEAPAEEEEAEGTEEEAVPEAGAQEATS